MNDIEKLGNVCAHLLINPSLLTEEMYRKQLAEAVQKACEFSRVMEGACAELNAHATELAMDLEQQCGWKLPDSWHRWNKRDHSPEQKWGEPLLERLRDALALAETLGEAEKGHPPALMLAYRLAERIREHKHDSLYQSQETLAQTT